MAEQEESLRELAIRTLAGAGSSRVKALELFSLYEQNGDKDDIVYAIVFELEVLHYLLERIHQENRQRTDLLENRIEQFMKKNNETVLSLVMQQNLVSRSQFRRLIALHRERFLNRLILVCALTILSVLAGLGTFFIYSLWI